MFERFSRSWQVVKLSWRLLMQDKELLLFPILSVLAAILLFVPVMLPSILLVLHWNTVATADGTTVEASAENALFWGFVLWYFVCAFVAIFMNAALVACVRKRLAGGDPTLGYGIGQAFKCFFPLLWWSILTTTVGILLRMASGKARERGGIFGIIGSIIISIIGFAWTIVTMFVVPVIMSEGTGVIASLKKSGQLLKKTWGEQLILSLGVSIVFGYFYAVLAFVLIASILASILFGIFLWPLAILAVLLLAVVGLFEVTLGGIFNTVLYSYAVGDNLPNELKQIAQDAFEKTKSNV